MEPSLGVNHPTGTAPSLAVVSPSRSNASRTEPTDHSVGESPCCRVLHVINGEHYSGAERVQDLLAERLPQFRIEVGFACVKPGKFLERRRSQWAPLYVTEMKSRFDVRPAAQVARIVREGGYQLLHAHTPRSALIGRLAALRAGVPFVYHVHSPTARDTTHRLRNWLNAVAEKWSIRGAARLITVSESLGRHMRAAGFDPRRISVAPNGVPSGEIVDRPLPGGTWTLGAVALFRPRKGMEVLLAALAALRSAGHAVRLRAVGPFETPQYEQSLLALAARLGLQDAVDWTGFAADVGAELAQMDLFVLPSLFGEGLPMVVLEAMAAGVPVIGTRVEGVPEAIRDGVDGLLAAPNDSAALAAAIARVLRGEVDWSALRASARQRQVEHFSDVAMAGRIAAIYREVLTEVGSTA